MTTSTPSRRRSLHVAGVSHGAAPIPMGCRVDNVLHTSGVAGVDPSTSRLAEGAQAQARFAFLNLASVLADGGASFGDVVRMTVYLRSNETRAHVNAEWVAAFPDPESRPARHILIHDLPGGMELQLEAMAVIAPSSTPATPRP
jgi:2-iminobutanoate/2-iminopropanoate deaminase